MFNELKNTHKYIFLRKRTFFYCLLRLSTASANFLMLLKQPAEASCRVSSDDPIVVSRY